jgi:hypothetical protein
LQQKSFKFTTIFKKYSDSTSWFVFISKSKIININYF